MRTRQAITLLPKPSAEIAVSQSAIPLNHLKIKFYGVRGSEVVTDPKMKSYGGDTSCIMMEAAGQLLVFDTGSGFRKFCEDYITRFKRNYPQIKIFMSHFHIDHILGAHIQPLMFNQSISKTIWGGIYHQHDGDYQRFRTASEQYNIQFGVGTSPKLANKQVNIGNLEFDSSSLPHNLINLTANNSHPLIVKTCPLPHGDELCIGYRVECNEGIVCVLIDFDLSLEKLNDYPEIIEFVKGADIIIADGMYLEDDFVREPCKKDFGHASAEAVIELAALGKVPDVYITHHDAWATDEELQWKDVRVRLYGMQRGINVLLARQGKTVMRDFFNTPLQRTAVVARL